MRCRPIIHVKTPVRIPAITVIFNNSCSNGGSWSCFFLFPFFADCFFAVFFRLFFRFRLSRMRVWISGFELCFSPAGAFSAPGEASGTGGSVPGARSQAGKPVSGILSACSGLVGALRRLFGIFRIAMSFLPFCFYLVALSYLLFQAPDGLHSPGNKVAIGLGDFPQPCYRFLVLLTSCLDTRLILFLILLHYHGNNANTAKQGNNCERSNCHDNTGRDNTITGVLIRSLQVLACDSSLRCIYISIYNCCLRLVVLLVLCYIVLGILCNTFYADFLAMLQVELLRYRSVCTSGQLRYVCFSCICCDSCCICLRCCIRASDIYIINRTRCSTCNCNCELEVLIAGCLVTANLLLEGQVRCIVIVCEALALGRGVVSGRTCVVACCYIRSIV